MFQINQFIQNFKPKYYLTYSVQVDLHWRQTIYSNALGRKQMNLNTNVLTQQYEETGILGEVAFQVLTGIPADLRLGVRDPYDFKVAGLEIDIKSTQTQNHLSIKHNRLYTKNNYYYVLCKVDLQTFNCDFLGWISGDKVNYNIDPSYQYKDIGIHKSKLNPMESLYNILKNRNALNGTGKWK